MIDRLVLAGQRHARHLLHRSLTSAGRPARHAVVFLFCQPARGADNGLRIATRMFLHGDDVEDLAFVLRELGNRVSDYRRAGVTHPLPLIVDRAEPMSRQVRYLATATSTLAPGEPGTPRPWRGLARLVDDTQIVVHHQLDPTTLLPHTTDMDVASSHTLNDDTAPLMFVRMRRWRYLASADHVADPDLADVQAALDRLHGLISDSEHRSPHHRR